MLAPSRVGAQEAQEELEEGFHRNIRVFQPKPFLKAQRVQLDAFGTATLNPRMVGNAGVGGAVDYHLSEYFSVGAQFTQYWLLGSDKLTLGIPMKQEVEEQFQLLSERNEIGYTSTLRFGVTPLFGKFAGGPAPYWDFSAHIGGGITGTVLNRYCPTIEAGVGLRFYLNRFLAVSAEVADLIYWESFKEGPTAMQSWTGRVGVALFVPFTTDQGGNQ